MPKRPVVGHVRGRSEEAPSMREAVVEGVEEETTEEQQTPTEIPLTMREERPKTSQKGKRKRNDRRRINYFGSLDDIISDVYEKEAAAYRIVQAVGQLFESRGQEVPFDDTRFKDMCSKAAMVQAMREVAWLYGLGPEHADRIAELAIERFFGVPKEKK